MFFNAEIWPVSFAYDWQICITLSLFLYIKTVSKCFKRVFLPSDEGQAAAMSSVKSVFSRKAVVRMQLLKEVVGADSYRINNKYDDNHTPLPVSEIIQRAQLLIGQEVSYDLLGSNCEHFVTLLRYGEGVSEQVRLTTNTTLLPCSGNLVFMEDCFRHRIKHSER